MGDDGAGQLGGATSTVGRHPTNGARRLLLELDASATSLLRSLPAVPRLAALVGRWRAGEAVVAWDPLTLAEDPFDLPTPYDVPDPDVFGGGWIGSWGYQLGGRLEELPASPPRPVEQQPLRVGFYDRVLRRVDGCWWFEQLTGLVEETQEAARAASFLQVLRRRSPARDHRVGAFTMTPDPGEHRRAVARVRRHIAAGDIYQANLTARLEAGFGGDPVSLFCAGVDALDPDYAALVSSPGGTVASLSPELFLRRVGREVVSSPIKGTAPLSCDPRLLTGSAKDRAENVMIVDLMRNDLGRVAQPGTVSVPALTRLERHAVWHLVSDVTARLRDQVTDGELLRATFPPGSVTGAPKVRAMQLLQGLEATAREAYTGAIGHLGPHAGMELNVAIRTFEIAAGRVWLGVGGGIVADSDPAAELEECLTKARPLVEAVGGRLAVAGTARHRPPPAPDHPARCSADAGLGVFDTLPVRGGVPVDLAAHLARLGSSVRELYDVELGAALADRVTSYAAGLAGPHRLRVDVVPEGGRLSTSITSRPLDAAPAALTLDVLSVPHGLGRHKWVDRRRITGPVAACRDRLVVDTDRCVLETGTAALFAVVDDEVCAPALDGRQLPSIAREHVGRALTAAGLGLVQRPLTVAELSGADEVFVANSLRGVVPVVCVEGVGSWPTGWVGGWLAKRLGLAGPAVEPGRPARVVRAAPRVVRPRVLFVDNYDSFVYNLVQYVEELGAATLVHRNDAVDVADLEAARDRGEFSHVVISPGPGTPDEAGISAEVIRRLGARTPVLGVCLGHQGIAGVFGGRVVRSGRVAHGKAYPVVHDGAGVLTGLPSPLVVGRYHSLEVEAASLPPELAVTARTPSGRVMGLRHTRWPVEGVQWHPESVLSKAGHALLANFLAQ